MFPDMNEFQNFQNIKSKSDRITELAGNLQDECHKQVEEMMKNNSKVTYQDATNVFIFLKVAEIIVTLNDVKNIKK